MSVRKQHSEDATAGRRPSYCFCGAAPFTLPAAVYSVGVLRRIDFRGRVIGNESTLVRWWPDSSISFVFTSVCFQAL